MIAGHVLLVFVYSVVVAPGAEHSDYQTFARESAPWFSIVAGGPVFYGLGRVLRGRLSRKARLAGLVVWGFYSAADLAILIAALPTVPGLLAAQWVVSQGVKLVAVLLATRSSE